MPTVLLGMAYGTCLYVSNFAGFANYIVLYLAATQDASVLFPVVSAAKIIAVWIIGRFTFREQLKLTQTIGVLAGIAAIVLLNL